jgi:hypothetical protein
VYIIFETFLLNSYSQYGRVHVSANSQPSNGKEFTCNNFNVQTTTKLRTINHAFQIMNAQQCNNFF